MHTRDAVPKTALLEKESGVLGSTKQKQPKESVPVLLNGPLCRDNLPKFSAYFLWQRDCLGSLSSLVLITYSENSFASV